MKDEDKKKERNHAGDARSGAVKSLLVDLNGQLQDYLKCLKSARSVSRSD